MLLRYTPIGFNSWELYGVGTDYYVIYPPSRLIIRNAVNASEGDAVIFVGSGCTAAVHRLIHSLGLRDKPHPPPVGHQQSMYHINKFERTFPLPILQPCFSLCHQVVFLSPFEHHSNLLPWRDVGAEVSGGIGSDSRPDSVSVPFHR